MMGVGDSIGTEYLYLHQEQSISENVHPKQKLSFGEKGLSIYTKRRKRKRE
jgi:hypothetical protein